MLYLTIILTIFMTIRFALFVKQFVNPYKLYMVFGKKGSGKTTYMCKLSYKYHKKGYNIYSNIDLPYSTTIDISTLGIMVPPPNSVLLVDEVGMIWDNRQFKNFRNDVRDYFKLQRHYRNIVYLFSQTFDIDVKLRNLTDSMYLCTCPLPFLSVVRRIKRSIVLVQPGPDAEGRIADSLEFIPFYMTLFGSRPLQMTYIPRWAPFFDSHYVNDLPIYRSEPIPVSAEHVREIDKYYIHKFQKIFKEIFKKLLKFFCHCGIIITDEDTSLNILKGGYLNYEDQIYY